MAVEWLSANSDVVCPSHPEIRLTLLGFEGGNQGDHTVLLRCTRVEGSDTYIHDMGLHFISEGADDGPGFGLRARVEARGSEWVEPDTSAETPWASEVPPNAEIEGEEP